MLVSHISSIDPDPDIIIKTRYLLGDFFLSAHNERYTDILFEL